MKEVKEEQFNCSLMEREVVIVREMLRHKSGCQKLIEIGCKFMPSCKITTHYGGTQTPDYSKCVHPDLR